MWATSQVLCSVPSPSLQDKDHGVCAEKDNEAGGEESRALVL